MFSCSSYFVQVCLERMQDVQLALVISRLYESEFESASTYKKILQRHVLGQDKQVPGVSLHWLVFFVLDYLFPKPSVLFMWHSQVQNAIRFHHFFFVFQIQTHPDPFLRSIAHWVLEDYSGALDTLLEQPVKNNRSVSTEGNCQPDLSYVLVCVCARARVTHAHTW